MNKPFISILIPCFNAADFIEIAIESIIKQNYPNLEIIIRDDCSTDNTLEIVNSLSKKYPITVFKNNVNLGMCGNWNQLFKDAKGEWILKLDADDILDDHILENAVKILGDHSEIHAVSFAYKIFESDSRKRTNLPVHSELEEGIVKNLFGTIFFKNPFSLCFTIFKKSCLLDLEENQNLFINTESGDLDFLLRFAKNNLILYFSNDTGGYYRYHTNNSSKEPLKQAKSWLEDVFPRHSDFLYTHYKKQATRTLNLRIIHYIKSLYTFRQKPNLNYLATSIKTYLKFKYGKI